MKNRIKTLTRLIAVLSISFLTACNKSEPEASTEAKVQTTIPSSLWLAEAPENVISVLEARKLAIGETVVVEGVIGAVVSPFTEGFASLVLGGESLMYCDEMGDDDHCAKPWDACCEDTDKLKATRLSIQIVAANGLPYPESLKGWNGLKENDKIIVTAKISEASTENNSIIDVSGIYKK